MTGQRVRWRLPDSPLLAGAIALVVMALFVAARLHDAAEGDIDRFVVAGTTWTDPQATDVPVGPGRGYDGQFFYRLALDPTDLAVDSRGVRLDGPYRDQRIGYPALAWVAAAGQPSLVPWALVVVNVLAVAALAVAAGFLARDAGRHALWGLFVAGFCGLLFSVGRDLAEPVAAACAAWALLALRRDRRVLAALAFCAGVLTRESVLLVAGGLALARLVAWWPARRPSWDTIDAVWVAPLLVFAGWQAVCLAVTGTAPAADGSHHLVVPFTDLVRAVPGWLREPWGTFRDTVRALQFLLLVVLGARVVSEVRKGTPPAHERFALLLAAVLAASLSSAIWTDWGHFRTLTDVYVLGAVALVTSRRSLAVPAVTLLLVWSMSAAQVVREI